MFLRGTCLLKLQAAFVGRCDRSQLTNLWIDAKILAGSQSEMFEALNLRLYGTFIVGMYNWRKVYPTKFIYELCELGVSAGTVKYLLILDEPI